MATYEVTTANIRLDEVVILCYGSLDQFSEVKEANPHLGIFLLPGDQVALPAKSTPTSEEVLW